MMLRTAFLHMDRTEALDQFALEKIGSKIEKLAEAPVNAQVTFVVEKGQHIVRLALKDKKGERLVVREAADNMYQAIHRVAAQIDRRLRRKKGRQLTQRHVANQKIMPEAALDQEDEI
ncbi:MAG: HPF/RaiA family ribosome-associated protein [Oligoflexus sp.]